MSVICVIWYKIFTVFQNYWEGARAPLVSATEADGIKFKGITCAKQDDLVTLIYFGVI
jgi:hypothetical protein